MCLRVACNLERKKKKKKKKAGSFVFLVHQFTQLTELDMSSDVLKAFLSRAFRDFTDVLAPLLVVVLDVSPL